MQALSELDDLVRGATDPPNPLGVVRHGLEAAAELVKITFGSSQVAASPRDHRFADPAWREDATYRRIAQTYLVWARLLRDVVDDVTPEWRTRILGRHVVDILASALAPTNFLLGNPAALRRAVETRGVSLQRGLENFLSDWMGNAGMPAQIPSDAFRVGKHLALTPGAVVHREEMFELLQYTPMTPTVTSRPLLVVPPPINKYYVADLSPGRSLVEFVVSQGVPCFLIAWRNPRMHHGEWRSEDYVAAQLRATEIVTEISGSDDLNVAGACAGGGNAVMALAVDAARGDSRVHSLTLLVTMIDGRRPSLLVALCSPPVLAALEWEAKRGTVLERRMLARMFSWMRPDDLVFNYMVNNWLMGEEPPAFDVLAWANDPTNIVARYDADILGILARSDLTRPGGVTALGVPLDLSRISCDAYVLIGLTDHLSPWRSAYMASQLLGGRSEVVMTSTGHVQSVVSPLNGRRVSYFTGPEPGPDPDAWREETVEHLGSWWPHWAAWLRARSGDEQPAPRRLGSPAHPPGDPAPGLYVLEQ